MHEPDTKRPEWLYIVETQVDPSIEEDWNRWYDEVHVNEMLACPGWLSGERYVREDESGRTYITLYGLSGPEALSGNAFEAARGWGQFTDRLRYSTKLHQRVRPAA